MSNETPHRKLNEEHLKKTIFEVPKGYFDELKEKIIFNTGIEKEVSFDDDLKLKENIFTTPENYFETLNSVILSKVKPEVKVIPMYQKSWFRSVAAAAVIILVAFFSIPKNTDVEGDLLSDISNEAIISYLEERQAIEYEHLSSVENLDAILNNMILEETSSYSFAFNENPELDYDFEYFDH
ncbi:hypothetical protein [Roseivirga echinicomitans]